MNWRTGMMLGVLFVVQLTSTTFISHRQAQIVAELDSVETAITLLAAVVLHRPRNLPAERDTMVVRIAKELAVPPTTALALAWVENRQADSTAISRAGAVGLLQVMPPAALRVRGNAAGAAAREAFLREVCGDSVSLMQRECNVRAGLTIYRDYLHRYGGDEGRALAAYNGALAYPRAARRYVAAVRTYAAALETVGTVQ